ncbi:MAG: hypothetical protein HC780_11035 [Leptolyngbyaceae cyanobacterium CSU_1_3]|nr:hypothetical protein [Leptolyngbyaceae cyanobacterium CSU_1_3]
MNWVSTPLNLQPSRVEQNRNLAGEVEIWLVVHGVWGEGKSPVIKA